LNISDCGIGVAIICTLYKPLAFDDRPQICSLMAFYEKVYRLLALFILTVGIVLLPFINNLVKGATYSPNLLRAIFIIFVADIVISYLFSYKRSILLADQNGYILSICYAVYSVGLLSVQMLIAKYHFGILLFFSIRVIFRIIENSIITYIANRKYSYLKEIKAEPLAPDIRNGIFDNTKALAFHYIGNYLTAGINNIVISAFISVAAVGIYGNYSAIILAAAGMISQFSGGITASFGNMIARESKDNILSVFELSFFVNFIIYNMAGVTAFVLITPFVRMWMGESGVLPFSAVSIIVAAFYLSGISLPLGAIRASAGIFKPDRYLHILIAGINLGLSITLVKIIGITGVFIGSLICICIKEIGVLPHIVYKYLFEKKAWLYYRLLLAFILSTSACLATASSLCSFVRIESSIADFIIKTLICLCVSNIIVFTLWSRTRYISDLKRILRSVLKNYGHGSPDQK